jgi:hypothetical protein
MHFILTFLIWYNKAFFIHGNAKRGLEEKENEVSVNTGVFLGISVAKKRLENTAQKKRLQDSVSNTVCCPVGPREETRKGYI